MKVTDLQAFLMTSPLPEPLRWQFSGGEWILYKRDALLIRVHTDQGLTGYAPGPASANIAQLINRNLRAAVVGLDPSKLETVRKKVFLHRTDIPGLAVAYGAVEMALLDLRGKAEGAPVSELLGGRKRQSIPLVAVSGLHASSDDQIEETRHYAGLGFKACKTVLASEPLGDFEELEKFCIGLPAGLDAAADAHTWWSGRQSGIDVEEIRRGLSRLVPFNFSWVGNPLPPTERKRYSALSAPAQMPLAAGSHEPTPQGLQELAADASVGLIEMDVTHQGGFQICQEVAKTAISNGRQLVFCNAGGFMEALVAAQLAACYSDEEAPWMEWRAYSDAPGQYPFPLATELLTEPPVVNDGMLQVPSTPGLGLAIQEKVLHRYPYKSGPWAVVRRSAEN